jgi:signal transduction histidine kinase
MRRPWQVWSLFALCLLAAAPAMLWVTFKALELDRSELAARLQAQQEEAVSSALWRIDARLTPILAEEAARPDFVYQLLDNRETLANVSGNNYLNVAPSHVLLHFELKPDGQGTSPQVCKEGKSTGPDIYCERLNELLAAVKFDQLLSDLPEQSLPQLTLLANNPDVNPNEPPQVVANSVGYDEALAQLPREQQPDFNNQVANDSPRQQAANSAPSPGRGRGAAYGQQEGVGNQAQNDYGNSRAGKDLQQRNIAYQAFTKRTLEREQFNEQSQGKLNRKPLAIREGLSRPLWVGDKLIFAHRVQRGKETVIQGCWLDWESLRAELLEELSELPGADFAPINGGDVLPGRILATLPVRLVVPPPIAEPPLWSPIRLALAVAWGSFVLAAGAAAWLLLGVVTLSERRASFVSAVTHELRTPLTTFRMYAEMLAADMVQAPQQRQQYLETLCVEADRLTHLVDNVLLYARLERTKPGRNRVSITIGEMLDRFIQRLADRAEQANLNLVLECDDATRKLTLQTDPGAVEQIVFNLIDNACKYAVPSSEQSIVLTVKTSSTSVELSVRDFGPGLSKSARRRLFQPFSKTSEEAAVTAPGVGLGLALCKRLATDLGGKLTFATASPGACFVLQLPR